MTSASYSSRLPGAVLDAGRRFGPWLAVAALAVWAAHPSGWLLAVAAGTALAGVVDRPPASRRRALASLPLLAGILAGFAAHRQAGEVASDFAAYWARQEAAVGAGLEEALEARLRSAEGAAADLAALATDSVPKSGAPLSRLRDQYDVTALALYGAEGELLAWDGVHRGQVPEEVQRGLRRYAYGDTPLFGHLYVTAPTGSGATAVAAVLLRSDLPGPLGREAGDFASDFRRTQGEPIRLVQGGEGGVEGGWDWTLGDRTLFTVVLDPPTSGERVASVLGGWRVLVGALALAAWLLLAVGGASLGPVPWEGTATLLLLAGVLPLQELGGAGGLFDVSIVGGPGPLDLSLGRTAALAAVLAAAATAFPPTRARIHALLAGALAGLAFPAVMAWLALGAASEALAEGRLSWIVFQGTATLLLTLVVGALLGAARSWGGRRREMASLAVLVAACLAAGTAAWVWRAGGAPGWWTSLWAVPVALAAASGAQRGARGRLTAWALAAFLAATAAVPAAWDQRVEARREIAAGHLERLAAPEDPQLQAALGRLGEAATAVSAGGERGVDLLYGAWRRSGLAELGAPAWLTLWSAAGIPQEELRVGVAERPLVGYEVQERAGGTGEVTLLRYDRDDARYVLRVTLGSGEILTAVAPPFSDPAARSGLSPLLGGGTQDRQQPLTLVPRAPWEGAREGLRWSRTGDGWRAQLPLTYSNALYEALYAVPLPGVLSGAARATLLVVADLLALLLLRALGLALLAGGARQGPRWSALTRSFRARVTLALFGFFVLAIALFGTLAYRTIADTSGRAARVLAERVAEDAQGWYSEVSGRMQALSRRVGVELLEYRGGELSDGSMEELVALGLYEAWLPMPVHRVLEGGEDVRASSEGGLGTWAYVSAYRRMPDGDVLAAQVPRQAGATAIRSADVLELLAFAVLVGAGLSLGLALLVGQALTRPLEALQVASERVGAGNLALRLPEDRGDEFGAVFRAFNRMVGRVRRARRQLVRTSRRTQTIMDEAAVGMVALDRSGRVTLVNPRAVGLLNERVKVGDPLPRDGGIGEDLVSWLASFLGGGREEAGVELQHGPRRIRVRARRLGGSGTRGGTVVALEDVTDELRTERVLAWGEMARQVAHEVKNPLTPMKLSVQHLRRAWQDRRPDFEAILLRNAEAMEEEIDRLAAIAKSFSRFGAPSQALDRPLEAVDVGRVVDDVLALYRGSEGPIAFSATVPEGLPAACARVTEMKEVLVNLLENARVASPLGGAVRVQAEEEPSGTVLLHVVDAGQGIPESLRSRVFEPQFSTRSTGAGLGLAIVRRLVESWGGTVGLESGEGTGTRITLRIPTWPGEPEAKG
ncbi:MAG TPA: ATP-binding protein [Longimicrobiales bacterium]|nr:ATP-binding protein [Longimicrobiales bacterium]